MNQEIKDELDLRRKLIVLELTCPPKTDPIVKLGSKEK